MIILDVETTGLDPGKNAIIDIGAINFVSPADRFSRQCKISADTEINPAAFGVMAYSEVDMRDPSKPTLAKITREFDTWTRGVLDRTLAGENPHFDVEFLRAAYERAGIEWSFGYRLVDQHTLAYAAMSRQRNVPLRHNRSHISSDPIMEYVGIPEEPKPHIAINGAIWEAEAISRLMHGKNLLEQFAQYPVPDYLQR